MSNIDAGFQGGLHGRVPVPPEKRFLIHCIHLFFADDAICSTIISDGRALSGLLGAWGIGLGLFSSSWLLSGSPRSAYDAVLLIYEAMIGLRTVTLGLIPSVVGRPSLRGDANVACR